MPNESPGTPALGHKPWKKRRPEIEPPKVVVVSEGQTELDYMEGMSRGNQKNFIYEAYKREPFDIDLTDKSDMLNLLDAQVQYMRGHATPFCYAT